MTEQELKDKRRAFLNETVAHYNSNNRAKRGEFYVYSPTETSLGCAIGRHVPNKELCKAWDNQAYPPKVSASRVYQNLPETLKELGEVFLIDIQLLHDDDENWGIDGLNERGQFIVNRIKQNYSLN